MNENPFTPGGISGIVGNVTAVSIPPPPLAPVLIDPGWKTSEGQLVALITTVLTGLAMFHWITPSQSESISAQIISTLTNLGPVFGAVLVLWNYITSRGKLKSNAVVAAATVAAAKAMNGVALIDEHLPVILDTVNRIEDSIGPLSSLIRTKNQVVVAAKYPVPPGGAA